MVAPLIFSLARNNTAKVYRELKFIWKDFCTCSAKKIFWKKGTWVGLVWNFTKNLVKIYRCTKIFILNPYDFAVVNIMHFSSLVTSDWHFFLKCIHQQLTDFDTSITLLSLSRLISYGYFSYFPFQLCITVLIQWVSGQKLSVAQLNRFISVS